MAMVFVMADAAINLRVVCVTGAASGIGAETCRHLRRAGAHVIGMDRSPMGPEVDEKIALDLADPESIARAVKQFPDGLDALCNVAGIAPCGDAARVLRVNFVGTRQLTLAALGRMRDGAAIINVASMAAMRFRADRARIAAALALPVDVGESALERFVADNEIDELAAYAFSKQAIVMWTKQLQCEVAAREIRVNSVSPGPVETPILANFVTAFGDKAASDLAVTGRAARAEEVAAVIAFLVGPEAGWVRGIDLPLDGGLEAARLTGGLA